MKFALSGRMAAGKSTISGELANQLGMKVVAVGGEIKPLATALIQDKQGFARKIERVIPNQELREKALTEIFTFFDENFSNAQWEQDENGVFIKNNDYRRLLQDFPMLVRQQFGEEIFAKLMVEGLDNNQSIICDDIRLPIEKELLEQNGFLIIRFDISKEEQKRRLMKAYGKIDEAALNHRTEVALDDASFDYRTDITGKAVPEIVQEVISFLKSVETN